jgi:hypothetical protein
MCPKNEHCIVRKVVCQSEIIECIFFKEITAPTNISLEFHYTHH